MLDSAPRLPLTRDKIVDSAIALANAQGLEALSMRKLAQVLGVKAMSLYNHVANKDELIDAMVDRVVGQIQLPDLQQEWQAAMRDRAHSARGVLLQHPWAPLAIMARVNVGPAMLRYIDATVGCLREAGFSIEMADHAWNVLDSHIYGFTLQELSFPFEPTEYQAAAERFVHLLPPERYPYLNEMTQAIIAGRYDGLHDFALGLEILLKGLDALREGA